MKASDLFHLPASLPFQEDFNPNDYPWEWVAGISDALKRFDFKGASQREDIPHDFIIKGDVYIHPNVQLPEYGYIEGPTYIGAYTELRQGVFIRGNVIVGEKCVLGNSCEYKNCLLMDNVQTPHFNYVGDSVLGTGSHLAAGVVTANLRLDRKPVSVWVDGEKVVTNMKKLGAMIGEYVEIGCNAVLQPGTILSKNVLIGPCVAVGGFIPEGKRVFAAEPVIS